MTNQIKVKNITQVFLREKRVDNVLVGICILLTEPPSCGGPRETEIEIWAATNHGYGSAEALLRRLGSGAANLLGRDDVSAALWVPREVKQDGESSALPEVDL